MSSSAPAAARQRMRLQKASKTDRPTCWRRLRGQGRSGEGRASSGHRCVVAGGADFGWPGEVVGWFGWTTLLEEEEGGEGRSDQQSDTASDEVPCKLLRCCFGAL